MAYGKRRSRPDGPFRAIISSLYRTIMRLSFGIESQDMNGLPKILKREALQQMRLQSEDHFFECEMVLKAARMGLRICAMDVNFYARRSGGSSIGWRDILAYVDHLIRVGTGLGDRWNVKGVPRWRPRPEWLYLPDGKAPSQAAADSVEVFAR